MPSLILISEEPLRQIFQLGKATLIIGRDDSSGIQISHTSVSRNHASIVFEEGNFVLHDNGSLNGTFVNGEKITKYAIKHHDLIRFGDCLFLVDYHYTNPVKTRSGDTHVLEKNHIGTPKGKSVTVLPKIPSPAKPISPVKVVLATTPKPSAPPRPITVR